MNNTNQIQQSIFPSSSYIDRTPKEESNLNKQLIQVNFFEKKATRKQLTRCCNLSNSDIALINKTIYIKITANEDCQINFSFDRNSTNTFFCLKSIESKKKSSKTTDYPMREVVSIGKGSKRFFSLKQKSSEYIPLNSARKVTTFEIYAYSSEISNLFKFKIYPGYAGKKEQQALNIDLFNPFQSSMKKTSADPFSLMADEEEGTTDEEMDIEQESVGALEKRVAHLLNNLHSQYGSSQT